MKSYPLLVVTLVILFVFTSSDVIANVSLLEAKGKQQECESFDRWIKKAQELGGEGVTGGHIQSQHFVKIIAPAFADSIFTPLIGKPYAKLSNRDKQFILKTLQRCKGKEPSFLPLAFETSKRSNTSTARELQVAIQKNVTEAVCQIAHKPVGYIKTLSRDVEHPATGACHYVPSVR